MQFGDTGMQQINEHWMCVRAWTSFLIICLSLFTVQQYIPCILYGRTNSQHKCVLLKFFRYTNGSICMFVSFKEHLRRAPYAWRRSVEVFFKVYERGLKSFGCCQKFPACLLPILFCFHWNNVKMKLQTHACTDTQYNTIQYKTRKMSIWPPFNSTKVDIEVYWNLGRCNPFESCTHAQNNVELHLIDLLTLLSSFFSFCWCCCFAIATSIRDSRTQKTSHYLLIASYRISSMCVRRKCNEEDKMREKESERSNPDAKKT